MRLRIADDDHSAELIATIEDLSALARHPDGHVVYGSAGVAVQGSVWALDVASTPARVLSHLQSGADELEPCHVAVDGKGEVLAVANYTSGKVAFWRIGLDGSLGAERAEVTLQGSGTEKDRQSSAHPHQVVFTRDSGRLLALVCDLGSDRVWRLEVSVSDGDITAEIVGHWAVPAGTGPRHLVILDDGRLAIAGELGSTLVVLDPKSGTSTELSSTRLTGPAKTRHTRNYPGDIARSNDGRLIFLANRSYGTIAMFEVAVDGSVALVDETDSGVLWPQHLLVSGNSLTVAGWDSSEISFLQFSGSTLSLTDRRIPIDSPGWLQR